MKVLITDLNHEGEGITRVDNKVVFVKYALPGEEVDIDIIKNKKNYSIGLLKEVIIPSKERICNKCPYYYICGGCNLAHTTYDNELSFKKSKVKNILSKYAGISIDLDIVSSNKRYNYRNKITLHKQNNKIGYMKEKTNLIIPIDKCLIANDLINNEIKTIKSNNEQIVLRTNGKEVIFDNNSSLIMDVNEYKFKIDINSFFQVNTYILEEIFKYMEHIIDNSNLILDLYSGVGTLSLMASKKANKVVGIEVNKYSYLNALENIKLNKISNVEFIHGKVEDNIKNIKEKVDLIITDPPRSGMDKKTINVIKELKPEKIVYMSCEPITLARDLNSLKELYELKSIKLFDMFPCTYHVESVCLLERKN